jgi:hypothetical protein
VNLIGRRRLKSIDLELLQKPQTPSDKLEWIATRGVPDYLDELEAEGTLPDGRSFTVYSPPDRDGYRREIQTVYDVAFQRSDLAGRCKLLRSYTSNFPQCAFDPDAWLWPLWQQWRSGRTPEGRKLLGALANGIRAKGVGWMSKERARVWLLAQAKRRCEDWSADTQLKRLYEEYAESARSPQADVRAESEKRLLPTLITSIQSMTGYLTSSAELRKAKLSGVLRLAISQAFGVRERDLH